MIFFNAYHTVIIKTIQLFLEYVSELTYNP